MRLKISLPQRVPDLSVSYLLKIASTASRRCSSLGLELLLYIIYVDQEKILANLKNRKHNINNYTPFVFYFMLCKNKRKGFGYFTEKLYLYYFFKNIGKQIFIQKVLLQENSSLACYSLYLTSFQKIHQKLKQSFSVRSEVLSQLLTCLCQKLVAFNVLEQSVIYLDQFYPFIIDITYMAIKSTNIKKLAYLGAAISEGQPVKGVQGGPHLLRNAGLFHMLNKNYGVDVVDYGDIQLQQHQRNLHPKVQFAVRNLNVLGPLLGRLHQKAATITHNKIEDLILTVGGDHSVGCATISAIKKSYSDLRVVWVDAHPDCTNSHIRNPQKYHSQNYHGMPLSHLTGMTSIPKLPYWQWLTNFPLLDPKNVVLLAIRDIDNDEYITLKKHGVKCFTMDHIDKYGIGQVMNQTINYLDPKNQHPFHLSFDIDAVDPDIAGQTGTRYRYGLSGRQSIHIVRRLAHERKLVGMDLVEINEKFNPSEDLRGVYRGEEDLRRVSKTVGLGIDLVSSLFTRYLQL